MRAPVEAAGGRMAAEAGGVVAGQGPWVNGEAARSQAGDGSPDRRGGGSGGQDARQADMVTDVVEVCDVGNYLSIYMYTYICTHTHTHTHAHTHTTRTRTRAQNTHTHTHTGPGEDARRRQGAERLVGYRHEWHRVLERL